METRQYGKVVLSFSLGAIGSATVFGSCLLVYVLFFASSDDARENLDTESIEQARHMEKTSSLSAEDSPRILKDLNDLAHFTSDFERSAALRSMLQSADESHVLLLLDQSKSIANVGRRLATQVEIFRRLAISNPKEATALTKNFAWTHRRVLIEAIFREWAVFDVDAAIAHARELDGSHESIALETILRTRDDWTESQLLRLAREFGHESIAADILEYSHVALAATDPEKAWKAILDDGRADDLQVQSLISILQLWIARDGSDVLSKLGDWTSNVSDPSKVLSPAFKQLAESHPEHTFDLAKSLDERHRESVMMSVIEIWAQSDPVAVLSSLSEIESSALRGRLQRTLIRSWARVDPRELLRNISIFTDEERYDVQGSALYWLARESSDEAIGMLQKIPNGIQRFGSVVVSGWSETDPRSAQDWILAQGREHWRTLLPSTLRYLVSEDAELAFETTLGVPITDGAPGLELFVIEVLARVDVDQAVAMLPRVRDESRTRELALQSVANALVLQNNPRLAVEIGQEIPESLRHKYFRNLFSRWSDTDKMGLFESLNSLPTDELKSLAAKELLSDSWYAGERPHRHFSDQQINAINALL